MNENWDILWGLDSILEKNVDKQKKIKQLNSLRAGVEKIRSLVSLSWPKWWLKGGDVSISKEETTEFLILSVKNLSRIRVKDRKGRKEGKQKGEEEEKQEGWRDEQGTEGSKVGKS